MSARLLIIVLHLGHVITALEREREEFLSFERTWRDEVRTRAVELRDLHRFTSGEIRERLGFTPSHVGPIKAFGALPSPEMDYTRAVVVTFGVQWRSHEEARRWATETLEDRVTFAADGSQIMPGREVSLPVAGVQVAWFENPHARDGRYTKDVRFAVVSPRELTSGGQESPEMAVNARRAEMEITVIGEFLERRKGWRERGERMPLAFLDNTFLLSSNNTENRFFVRYAEAILRLLKQSRETEVPVVGYIDQSRARDLVHLLDVLGGRPHATAVYDSQLLRADDSPRDCLLPEWGDRTVFSFCLREGFAEEFRDDRNEPLVGFVYLQTTADGAPARLDVPSWVYEHGLLDEMVDTVRAECVVGNGYPYALETADAAAVLTMRDREQFLRVMQDFAARGSLPFRFSRKAVSKVHRR